MKHNMRRWLFHRRVIRVQPGWWLAFQRQHGCCSGSQETTWEVIARDRDKRIMRGMLITTLETRHITRAIYQGDTVAGEDSRTQPMETAIVRV